MFPTKIRLLSLAVTLLAFTACATAESTYVAPSDPPPTATASPTAAPEAPTPAPESLIMLQDPLDEPEFYCIDVAGFGSSLNLEGPLQAHTCKPGADDELFIFNFPGPGQFYMDAYDLCLAAADGALYVRACADSADQRFAFDADGLLRLQDADRCVAVQAGSGQPAGGRSHVRRDLLLQDCAEVQPELARWALPGPRP